MMANLVLMLISILCGFLLRAFLTPYQIDFWIACALGVGLGFLFIHTAVVLLSTQTYARTLLLWIEFLVVLLPLLYFTGLHGIIMLAFAPAIAFFVDWYAKHQGF